MGVAIVRMLNVCDGKLPDLVFGITEHLGIGRIAGLEPSLQVSYGNADGRILENPTKALLALPQRRFGRAPVGHVEAGSDIAEKGAVARKSRHANIIDN